MKKQNGNVALIVLIIILVAFAFWWLMKAGYLPYAPKQTTQPTVQNTQDLDTASKDLDGTDVNEVDVQLGQLNTEASF
ncbi:MAG TPA: hypothetical protein VFI61_02070 [Patescibacteria group bacterium]|nr:hypothetical protein [Patescibacteria group bacterium]